MTGEKSDQNTVNEALLNHKIVEKVFRLIFFMRVAFP